MFKSQAIEDIVKNVSARSKTEEAVINEIKNFEKDFSIYKSITFKNLNELSTIVKNKRFYYKFLALSLPLLLTIFISLMNKINLNDKPISISSGLVFISLVMFLGALGSFFLKDLALNGYEKILNKIKSIKTVFNLLSDKPYEIRFESVPHELKVKIIIEENELQGNNVIKEKSKHITAYYDLNSSKEDTVIFIHSLVKKTEELFK